MNWDELLSYIQSYLKRKNCARTLELIEVYKLKFSDYANPYLYVHSLLYNFNHGISKNEIVKLRQFYISVRDYIEDGNFNNKEEINREIKFLTKFINSRGSKAFDREVYKFYAAIDKIEEEVNRIAPFKELETVDHNIFDFCQFKIKETKALEELLPHGIKLWKLVNKKKRQLIQEEQLKSKKKFDYRLSTPSKENIEKVIQEIGILPRLIWQESENYHTYNSKPGQIKYTSLANFLLDNKYIENISHRHLCRKLKILTEDRKAFSIIEKNGKFVHNEKENK